MAGHVVAGVELVRLVSLAGGVELWVGRTADGELRDVCLVEVPPGPAAMSRALVAVTRFVGISHAALQPVLAAAPHGQRLALVRPVAEGLPLDEVLISIGGLGVGEGATLATSLAGGLAALHRRGLAHGAVGAGVVRVAPDGSVVLVDLGVAVALDHLRTPADDVLDLARMVTAALAPEPEPAAELTRLLTALDPALSGHPAARPGAGPLATSCAAAASGVPLRLPRPRVAVARRPARRAIIPASGPNRRRLTRIAVAAGAVAGLALALTAVLPQLDRFRSPARAAVGEVVRPGPAARSITVAVSWSEVLTELARGRARAYAAADPNLLTDVDAGGSSADAIDRANVTAWRESGERIVGGVPVIRIESSSRTGATVAEVTTLERVASYTVIDGAGHRAVHPAGPDQRWRVQLVETAAGWRTVRVTAAGGAG